MTTQRDAFDERLTRLEGEFGEVKELLGELAELQAQMLNTLDRVADGVEENGRRIEAVARHLRVSQKSQWLLESQSPLYAGTCSGSTGDLVVESPTGRERVPA